MVHPNMGDTITFEKCYKEKDNFHSYQDTFFNFVNKTKIEKWTYLHIKKLCKLLNKDFQHQLYNQLFKGFLKAKHMNSLKTLQNEEDLKLF
jgi:predicted alpha/beta-fold hydrolase